MSTFSMTSLIRTALTSFLLLTLITGVAYPLLVTAIGRAVMPAQAAGSLIEANGRVAGSALIGQSVSAPRYFWGRPSATSPQPYNAAASSGSNLGPSNPALREAVAARVEQLRAADPGNTTAVPIDLVTASASGLDPHISPAAALYQAPRVARERGVDVARVRDLIAKNTEGRQWGILGEARVNVMRLNLALDQPR
jgi:K+-transporting ATPase ATPase C chain